MLGALLRTYAQQGAAAFEPAREAAVLSRVDARADALAAAIRERDAEAIVTKYTKRAVIGALAAVMPGSDLVIQAVLATGLVRELSKLFDVHLARTRDRRQRGQGVSWPRHARRRRAARDRLRTDFRQPWPRRRNDSARAPHARPRRRDERLVQTAGRHEHGKTQTHRPVRTARRERIVVISVSTA